MLRTTLFALSLLAAGVALRLGASAGRQAPPPAGATALPSGIPTSAPPLSYEIEARVDAAAGQIHGQLRLHLRNTSRAPLRELQFHLYLNAFASEKSHFMRTSGGSHRGHQAGRPGWIEIDSIRAGPDQIKAEPRFDGTVAVVQLPRALAPAAGLRLQIAFRAQLPQLFARTGRVGDLLMAAQWYPKLGFLRADGSWHCPQFHANSEFFAEFANYDVSIQLPARYIVGASGERQPRGASPTGPRHRFVASWTHDFVFVAWPHFRRIERRLAGVEVELLTVPGRDAARQLELVEFGLEELRRLFFPYPYPRLTVVDLPRNARPAAAMEYPTLFTTRTPAGTPLWLHPGDEITLHELVHQLFHGVVATNEVSEPWLDEGITTYISGLMLDRRFGASRSLFSLGALRLGQRAKNHLHALLATEAPIARPAAEFSSWRSYGANVYGRAASLLYTLESLIGKHRVLEALSSYAQAGRFRHPSGALLEREIRARSPAGSRATVAALLDGVLREGARLDARLRCTATQIVLERGGSLSLPLELHWRDTKGRERRRALGPKERFALPAHDVKEAWLGPPGRLALDANPADNHCRREDGRWGMALRYLPALRQLLALVGP